jgi:hypothetical protein
MDEVIGSDVIIVDANHGNHMKGAGINIKAATMVGRFVRT